MAWIIIVTLPILWLACLVAVFGYELISKAKMNTPHLATNSWKYQHFVTQPCVCSVHKLQIIWTRKMHSNKSDIGSDSPVVWWAERGSRSSEPLYAFSSAAIPRRTTCSIRWNVTWCCIKLIQLLEGICKPNYVRIVWPAIKINYKHPLRFP